jgi:D-alanine-D-alanine ligase
VAVLLGGRSAEREVSLSSGAGVAKALRSEGFDVVEVDPGENLAQQLLDAKPDAVFNALHGRFGEDGTVQGLLELYRIPYTHSGVLASSLAMHKQRTKDVYRAAGLPVVNSIVVDRREASDTWNLSNEMMVEEYVPGRELTVAVMGGKGLGVTEITTNLEFYDYEAKYSEGGSLHVLPAKVSDAVAKQALDFAERAHVALGCRGVSRTDFRYDDSGGKHRLVLLETNTQPGMTPTSLVPEQAAYNGMSYAKLCRWIVEDASCDR